MPAPNETATATSQPVNTSGQCSDLRDIAEKICSVAYLDGKSNGLFSATVDILACRLQQPLHKIERAICEGEKEGLFRRRSKGVELTSTGIYFAKLLLKLPT